MVTASVIKYYQCMMNALQPFATKKTNVISVCDRFIQGFDPHLLPCFCPMYPMHSTIHNLDGAYQRQQLPVILVATQAVKDKVKGVQDIARSFLGQGFYANYPNDDAAAYKSQAEQTLACYGEGAEGIICRDERRRVKECFGCGGDHSWMANKRSFARVALTLPLPGVQLRCTRSTSSGSRSCARGVAKVVLQITRT
jgi:hypothetical protein